MLPLGFEFGYVTCFGQWIISRPKAWRVFDKHLKMRLISLYISYCYERYMPGLPVCPRRRLRDTWSRDIAPQPSPG